MKKENRFPFELDLEGARKIIDVACSNWKDKLSDKWSKALILYNRALVTEPFYKEMRKACNEEQHKVLDEVFGKDEKSVEDVMEEIIAYNKNMMSNGDLVIRLLETFDIKFKE